MADTLSCPANTIEMPLTWVDDCSLVAFNWSCHQQDGNDVKYEVCLNVLEPLHSHMFSRLNAQCIFYATQNWIPLNVDLGMGNVTHSL